MAAIERPDVYSNRRYGFAAGCEAVAIPRRLGARTIWALPLVRAQPSNYALQRIQRLVIEIVEAYKDWQPPMNARKAVAAVVSSVPDEYLIGLRRIIMTNSSGLNRSRRRKKPSIEGKRKEVRKLLGAITRRGRASQLT